MGDDFLIRVRLKSGKGRHMKRRPFAYVILGLWLATMVSSGCSSSEGNAAPPVKQPVIFFSGGCIDDFVVLAYEPKSAAILLNYFLPRHEPVGVSLSRKRIN